MFKLGKQQNFTDLSIFCHLHADGWTMRTSAFVKGEFVQTYWDEIPIRHLRAVINQQLSSYENVYNERRKL